MDQDISAKESTKEKMLPQESSVKDNGSISVQDSEFTLEYDPLPQRKLKLNRRGFFLLDRKEDKESNESSIGIVNHSNQKDISNSPDRLKSPPSSQKKIKLITSAPDRQNGVKRTSMDTMLNGTDQTSPETPAKKKHKPITWP